MKNSYIGIFDLNRNSYLVGKQYKGNPQWLKRHLKKATPALGVCKSRQKIFCEIDWSYLCLATIRQILHFVKTNFADIRQKDILTLDGLEKGKLIQLDDVTRIKLVLRNQGQMAPFVCYLDSKIGNFEIDKT